MQLMQYALAVLAITAMIVRRQVFILKRFTLTFSIVE